MENEQEHAGIAGPSGVTRGQNQLHIVHEDWRAAADVVATLLDRVAPDTRTAQIVVVTRDEEAASGIAEHLARASEANDVRVLAATSARRATRVQRAAPAHVVIGDAVTLAALLEGATLKMDAVKAVVLAWVDEVGPQATSALEGVMAEMPKDAARVVFAAEVNPAVEALVERYARRARRLGAAPTDNVPPVSLSFVSVSERGRLSALRRILDTLDPTSALVVVADDGERQHVRASLATLGYVGDDASIRVAGTPESGGELLILYDLHGMEQDLRAIVAARGGNRVVALVTPRQIAALRRAAGGTVSPLVLPEAAERARTREQALRDELRHTLESEQFSRELLSLEPLLEDYDGAEVAAAALRLLESERVKAAQPLVSTAPKAVTRLYLNVGTMDNVRPGDLVGAITNEAGVSRAELGRVDVRERHSTVEVATPIANAVVAKLTGVTIRGRRVIAKVDEGPTRRDRPEGRDRPARGERPERSDRPRRPRRETSDTRGRRDR